MLFPLAGSASWSASAPTSYATLSTGTVTLYPWAKDAAGNVSAVYATPVTLTLTAPGRISSLEFGHTTLNKDYCNPISLPMDFGNGALFSVWTKIPVPVTTQPRGNMNVYFLYGDNWHIICLDGNLSTNPDGTARYNANFMLGDASGNWLGDFCTCYSLPTENITMDQANDWVWVAWQVVVNPDRSMVLRQWLKFGINGAVFPAGHWSDTESPGEEFVIPGGTSIEGAVIPESWNPSPPRSFRLGDDNTWSGQNTPSNSYLCHARMQALSTKPTLAELDAIARANVADTTAWGDWELNWHANAPNLSDRSGHGHSLSIQSGGALYQGVLGPVF